MKSLQPMAGLLLVVLPCASQRLACGPVIISLQFPGDIGNLGIYDASGGSLTFKYIGTEFASGMAVPDALNYVVLVPSSGTAPQGTAVGVTVGVNSLVAAQLQPGLTYSRYPIFAAGQILGGGCRIDLTVPAEPNPAIQSVVSAASLQPILSPGALVSIFGSHLTGPTLSTTYDFTASYPTVIAGTSVTFNGIAAPLLYLSPGQINAIVPFALAGKETVQIVVQRFNQTSAPVTLPLQDTSPAIFTAAQGGTGQGAILQQGPNGQFSYNSSSNPAPRGAALEIFATGMGVWTPPPQSDVFLLGAFFQDAAGLGDDWGPAREDPIRGNAMGTPLSSWSVLQVNAVVPDGAGSGPQSVVLKIGNNDNSQ